jgi:hypothetical protein
MELELKHLATAFANNQQVLYYDDERELNQICRIVELREDELTISNREYQYDVSFDDVKLISLPLSYLTKEIEFDGEKFVPCEKLLNIQTNGFAISLYKDNLIRLTDAIILYKYHFDIYGLIEKGLAIDINSLPQSSE